MPIPIKPVRDPSRGTPEEFAKQKKWLRMWDISILVLCVCFALGIYNTHQEGGEFRGYMMMAVGGAQYFIVCYLGERDRPHYVLVSIFALLQPFALLFIENENETISLLALIWAIGCGVLAAVFMFYDSVTAAYKEDKSKSGYEYWKRYERPWYKTIPFLGFGTFFLAGIFEYSMNAEGYGNWTKIDSVTKMWIYFSLSAIFLASFIAMQVIKAKNKKKYEGNE